MKTIGLLGGMSWESTQTYYRVINEGVRHALGGLHSAKIVLYSVDFAEIELLQMQGDWQQAAALLTQAAQSVEKAGADFLLICTNTMHKVAPEITLGISIPVLHIADATANAKANFLLDEGGNLKIGSTEIYRLSESMLRLLGDKISEAKAKLTS